MAEQRRPLYLIIRDAYTLGVRSRPGRRVDGEAASLRAIADALEAMPLTISGPSGDWGDGWVQGQKDERRGMIAWLRAEADHTEASNG